MTEVSKVSAYPKSVQPGLPRLGATPPGWSRGPLSEHLFEELRPVKMADDEIYDLVTVKRSRGGVVLRERLKGKEIAVKSQFRLRAGDFLISKRQIVHGACGVVPPELDGAIVSNEYAVLRARPSLDLTFLSCLAHSIYFQQTCFHSSIGVHVEKMIFKLGDWLQWDFDLPPARDQRLIAEILSSWDRAIETVEALIANARAQKAALMQALLSGRTRLPGFDGEWLRKRLGDFVAPERSKCEPQSLGSEVRVIELEHIEAQTGRIIGTGLAREQASLKTPFTPNHVLYGKLRPYLRKFARPTFSGVCSTEIWALSANPAYCTPGFLNLLVQTTTFDGAVNISAGSKMPRAEWGVVAEAIVALPSLPEQLAISGLMETVSEELENREEQLGALRQEKAALMQQLLTGKRPLKLAESEAA